ncbi:MFS transporter, PAT family, beta-lactamase induction signal transducer AmpG [Halopseudomonas xinjiangensis]|uniref:MFS transporter, PAT family, beta-lactamase induction signal transducer AmpG n=1 Tax=Halopseudomonas xinjiangensis TaxID=487184 RepID=A0A1H1UTX3_9GAMM|nr:MFS transporter [Halopseudomonas xinjiangensis]SDS75309.1 MFS transporter, PAT family, beta-lactamase induction signal transducer AmpG [Halopseudomonas xinjiangensis]
MTDNQAGSADLPSEGWQVYLKPRVIAMLFLGFSAGLPLLLVGGTFSAWLRDLGIELSAIGFLSWVGMAYSVKVLWAPIIDRAPIPLLSRLLGRRRAWMLLSQLIIILALTGMALSDPREHLGLVALFAVMTAFGSATQDIAIDAYRVEAEAKHRQAAMAATYVTGYRVAILAAGAGALHLASLDSWTLAYLTMAVLMGVGVATTLIIAEPAVSISESTNRMEARVQQYLAQTRQTGWKRDLTAWFIGAMLCPFADFFQRYGKAALLILAFIATFRISDIFMGVMANPFYLDLGFTKAEIANIAAAFGLGMTLAGAALGGLLVARFGIAPMLIATAFMAPATNIAFAWLAYIGPQSYGLVLAIIADNITGGLAISVFIAYLSSLTNTAYTATQYALFSSLMTLPGQFAAGFTGLLAANVGWIGFFTMTAFTGLPAIVLAFMLLRFAHPDKARRPGID